MRARQARDALLGLILGLVTFAYEQMVRGSPEVAAATVVVIAGLTLVYRYADAVVIESFGDVEAEELKPIIRLVVRRLRRFRK